MTRKPNGFLGAWIVVGASVVALIGAMMLPKDDYVWYRAGDGEGRYTVIMEGTGASCKAVRPFGKTAQVCHNNACSNCP